MLHSGRVSGHIRQCPHHSWSQCTQGHRHKCSYHICSAGVWEGSKEEWEGAREGGREEEGGDCKSIDYIFITIWQQNRTYKAVSLFTTDADDTLINITVAVVVCVSWCTDTAVVIEQIVASCSVQTRAWATLICVYLTVLSLHERRENIPLVVHDTSKLNSIPRSNKQQTRVYVVTVNSASHVQE